MQNRSVKPGLRVLVTAGASGIGRKIAEALVEDGASVHICDINEDMLKEARTTVGVTVSRTDVSREDEVVALMMDVEASLGGLDVLVNNAGIAGPTGGVDEINSGDWERTIDVNLNSQFYCVHHAVPLLRKNPESAIVNMSSSAGKFGYAFRTPYATAKWGIIGFTQSLAKELGPSGVRVNAILPGMVEGPRVTAVIAARAKQTGVSYEEMERSFLQRTSLRKLVTPDDVASAVIFLCSKAGWNISGQSISIDGNLETL